MLDKTAKFLIALPFTGAKALITGDRRPFIQGAILSPCVLVLLAGYLNAQNNRIPVTAEYLERLDFAQAASGDVWDDPIPLAPIDYHSPEESDAPYPQRKPDVSNLGYSGADRDAMNQLFAEVQ